MTSFKLTKDSDFIPLDKLLKLIGIVGSGGEAHAVITDGLVKVNDVVETQKRKKLRADDVVEFNNQKISIQA